MTRGERTFLLVAFAIVAIGGALLFAKAHNAAEQSEKNAEANARFICAFGEAVTATPIRQRAAETKKEFRQRLRATRGFISRLREDLEGCDLKGSLQVGPKMKNKPKKGEAQDDSIISGNSSSSGSLGGGSSGGGGGSGSTAASAPAPAPTPGKSDPSGEAKGHEKNSPPGQAKK